MYVKWLFVAISPLHRDMKRAIENIQAETKKKKLDNNQSKIPQLNEDVIGIILRHVVRKQKIHIAKKFAIIKDHFKRLYHQDNLGSWETFVLVRRSSDLDPYYFKWPESLKTNSQRLVHHSKIKMFPNIKIDIYIPLDHYIVSNRQLDLMLETFKHFNGVVGPSCAGSPAEFIRENRNFFNYRHTLVDKLEEIKN